MSNRKEFMRVLRAIAVSLKEVETQSLVRDEQMEDLRSDVKSIKTNVDLLVASGKSSNEAAATLTRAFGDLLNRLEHYLEDSNRMGGRVLKLERRADVTDAAVKELRDEQR